MNKLFAILIVLLCAGCAAPPKPTIGRLDMAAIESRPDFVSAVSPPEYSIISSALYQYLHETVAAHGILSGKYGFNSSLCVRPNLGFLVQQGDKLLEESLLWERMELFINNDPMQPYDFIAGGLPAGYPDGPYKGHTAWIDGADYCWKAPLEAGLHKVTFQFQQTSGDVQSYVWYFQITE